MQLIFYFYRYHLVQLNAAYLVWGSLKFLIQMKVSFFHSSRQSFIYSHASFHGICARECVTFTLQLLESKLFWLKCDTMIMCKVSNTFSHRNYCKYTAHWHKFDAVHIANVLSWRKKTLKVFCVPCTNRSKFHRMQSSIWLDSLQSLSCLQFFKMTKTVMNVVKVQYFSRRTTIASSEMVHFV